MKTPYEILGVEKTTPFMDIRRAYKRLAAQYHPDREGGDKEKFQEINRAFGMIARRQICETCNGTKVVEVRVRGGVNRKPCPDCQEKS